MRTTHVREWFGFGIPLLLGLLPGVSPTAGAETLTVGLGGGADFAAIQPAIEEALDGDTILVRVGEYVIDEPITFPGPMDLTLKAESGPEATTIRMSDTSADPDLASVFLFDKGETESLVVEGFTITGGRGIRRPMGESFSDRGGGGVVCIFESSPTFIDCHITGNSMDFDVGGGGVYCVRGSSPTFQRCRITNNHSRNSGWGGGILCTRGSSPTFLDCLIAGNSAGGQGGGVAIHADSSPTFVNCRIDVNSTSAASPSGGGGVLAAVNSVTPRFERCVFSGNTTAGSGGALRTNTSEVRLEDCIFVGNTANEGGAVSSTWFPAPTLVRCTIIDNAADSRAGGIRADHAGIAGILASDATLSLTSCIVWGNRGEALLALDGANPVVNYSCIEGGWPGFDNIDENPLFCWSEPDVLVGSQSELETALRTYRTSLAPESPCLEAGEDGENMGAYAEICSEPQPVQRTVNLSPGTYAVNGLRLPAGTSLQGAGAAETIVRGTIVGLETGSFLSRLTVTGGTSGGVVVGRGEAPEIRECTITGNTGNSGGGVHCEADSSPTFTACRIIGNEASRGGAVYCAPGSTPTFINSVISRNSAVGSLGFSAVGGGIYCLSRVTLTVLNCTLSANSAQTTGGAIALKAQTSSATVTNSILWENQGGSIDVASDAGIVVRYSCIDSDSVWPGEGNVNADPLFAEDTFHLQAGSPAIDAGTPDDAPLTDLEGNRRPCGGGVDMGAYESDCVMETPKALFVRGDCNADGSIASVTDALVLLSFNFSGAQPPACLAACDVNGDGATGGVTDAVYLLSFSFSGGPPPVPPFPDCGEGLLDGDETLGCGSPPEACP